MFLPDICAIGFVRSGDTCIQPRSEPGDCTETVGLADCPVLYFDFETDEGLSFKFGAGGSFPVDDHVAVGVSSFDLFCLTEKLCTVVNSVFCGNVLCSSFLDWQQDQSLQI